MKNISVGRKLVLGSITGVLSLSLLCAPVAGVNAANAPIKNGNTSVVVSLNQNSVTSQAQGKTVTTSFSLPASNQVVSDNGQQISALGRKILSWVKSKGSSWIKSLRDAVKRGVNAVKDWLKYKLPKHLYDAAVALGLESLAEWIINNWPWEWR